MTKKPIDEIPKTFKGIIYKLLFYRTKELLWILLALMFFIILAQSLSWGVNEDGNFWIKWGKAANIDIKIEK